MTVEPSGFVGMTASAEGMHVGVGGVFTQGPGDPMVEVGLARDQDRGATSATIALGPEDLLPPMAPKESILHVLCSVLGYNLKMSF